MIKEKYKQLCLSPRFGGISRMNIDKRCSALKTKKTEIENGKY